MYNDFEKEVDIVCEFISHIPTKHVVETDIYKEYANIKRYQTPLTSLVDCLYLKFKKLRKESKETMYGEEFIENRIIFFIEGFRLFRKVYSLDEIEFAMEYDLYTGNMYYYNYCYARALMVVAYCIEKFKWYSKCDDKYPNKKEFKEVYLMEYRPLNVYRYSIALTNAEYQWNSKYYRFPIVATSNSSETITHILDKLTKHSKDKRYVIIG